MTHIVDKFREAIHDSFVAKSDKGLISIVEKAEGARNKLFILDANAPHFAFSLDREKKKGAGHPVFPVLNTSCSGICSVADMIVLCRHPDDSDLFAAFVIELKSGNRGKAQKQIKSSLAFLRWLGELLEVHHGCKAELQCFGLVVTARKTPPKRTTKVRRLEFCKADKKDQFKVAEWDNGSRLFMTQLLVEALGRPSIA